MRAEQNTRLDRPAADAPAEMIDRLIDARDAIEARIAECQSQLAKHYARQDQLEAERDAMQDPEEKATQNEIIAVVRTRIRSFDNQINTCQYDLRLLRQYGAVTLENPQGNAGDLARILDKYGIGRAENLPERTKVEGLDALPYFARPGATSGVPHLTKISSFEKVAHRVKMVVKMGALVAVIVLATRGLDSDAGGATASGARFERAGSSGMARIMDGSSAGSSDSMPGTTAALLKMVSATTGFDLRAIVSDTGQALKSVGVGD